MGQQYQDELIYSLELKANNLIKELPNFAKTYFDYLLDRNSSERTRVQYAYDLKYFFEWLQNQSGFKGEKIKPLPPSDVLDRLTKEDLQEYVASLRHVSYKDKYGKEHIKKASDSTIARKICSLRSFYRYFYTTGDIKKDTASLLAVPDIKIKEVAILERNDVQRLLEEVELDANDKQGLSRQKKDALNRTKKRDLAIYMLFFGTGMRVSELVGIDLEDLDLKNCSVILTRKGGNQDTTYFSKEVRDALSDYIENERVDLLSNNDSTALFISLKHSRISQRSVERMIKNYGSSAGMNKKVTPHTTRRTYGTTLYRETRDVFLVADALHHVSTETAKKYIKMDIKNKQKAAQTAAGLFKKDE